MSRREAEAVADALAAVLREAHSVPVGDPFDKAIHAARKALREYRAATRAGGAP